MANYELPKTSGFISENVIAWKGFAAENVFMNKQNKERKDKWAEGYFVLLNRKGGDERHAPWYMRRAEAFMQRLKIDDPGAATREGTETT